jgi:ABC-type transport system involved in multi-copper enzyme maturation permease subunit
MSSLLWKEWHEQRWKLAFGCIILSAFALIGLHTRVIADELLLNAVCFLGVMLLPVLAATGLIPAERSDGTFESLLALPTPPSRILAAKTIMGAVLCAGPLLAAGAISLLMAGGREMSAAAMIRLYASSIATSFALVAWMMSLTLTLPGEARAALLSMGILVFWVLATAGLNSSQALLRVQLRAISPFTFVFAPHDSTVSEIPQLVVALVQSGIVAMLWIWSARRLSTPLQENS